MGPIFGSEAGRDRVYLAGLYMSASFARSFVHEATVLFNRRHALRYGRLCIWLEDGKVDSKLLGEVFGGNFDNGSSFVKIDPSIATKGLVSQFGEMSKSLQKTAESLKKAKEKT